MGVQAAVDPDNRITQLGITCALCHSTVDNSVLPGIGKRMDGWPNRDLDVGAIVALSPALPTDKKAVYQSWGPGKYDPRYNIDGKSTPLTIPPAYGLAEVKNETYTAEGPISYWNAYVAVTPDARARQLLRSTPWHCGDALTGHSHPEAGGTARLPAQPASASCVTGKLRWRRCGAGTCAV